MIESIFGDQFWWYLARTTGIVAWVLLSASLIWGLLMAAGLVARGTARVLTLEVHRFLGTLAVAFTGLHLVGLFLDSYVQFELVDFLVPFATDWNPLAVAWGVTAMYLLIAIQFTSQLMRWMPRGLWRAVHLLSFPLFAMATVHTLTAGTDAGHPLMIFTAVGLSVFVALLTALRAAFARADRAARPAPTEVATVAV